MRWQKKKAAEQPSAWSLNRKQSSTNQRLVNYTSCNFNSPFLRCACCCACHATYICCVESCALLHLFRARNSVCECVLRVNPDIVRQRETKCWGLGFEAIHHTDLIFFHRHILSTLQREKGTEKGAERGQRGGRGEGDRMTAPPRPHSSSCRAAQLLAAPLQGLHQGRLCRRRQPLAFCNLRHSRRRRLRNRRCQLSKPGRCFCRRRAV